MERVRAVSTVSAMHEVLSPTNERFSNTAAVPVAAYARTATKLRYSNWDCSHRKGQVRACGQRERL
jgi:hypothetical protein